MNRSKHIGVSCIVAIAITAAGCGEVTLSPDAAPPDTGPVVTGPLRGDVALDDAWQCMVDAACGVVAGCFGEALSVEQCLELDLELLGLSGRHGDILVHGAIAQGTLTYDAVAMGECLDTVRQMTCVGDAAGAPGACMRASEVGDACDDGCFPFFSLYCNRPEGAALGTCELRLGEGEDCNPERSECQFGLRCDSTLQVCIAGQLLNQACGSDLPCEFFSGLHCTSEIDGTATGICQGPQPTGQPCRYGSHCQSGYCYQSVCTDVASCY
jgi:hypothetical protein